MKAAYDSGSQRSDDIMHNIGMLTPVRSKPRLYFSQARLSMKVRPMKAIFNPDGKTQNANIKHLPAYLTTNSLSAVPMAANASIESQVYGK